MIKFNLDKVRNANLKPSNLYVGGMTRDEVREKIGDKTLYKLSSNENLLGPSPKAVAAIKSSVELIGEYPDRSDERLRTALSEYYGNIESDQFVCGNSGSEVLEFICRAFLTDDSEYIVSNPCFKPYQMFSDKLGAKMVDVRLIMDNDNYRLDVEGILGAITPQTRLIFLTSPNNPTGTYIPRADVYQLLDKLPDHVVVVYDEVYARYADAEDYAEATEFVNKGYPVIGLNSFSKLFGLAGLRLGYAYTTKELSDYIRRLYKPFILNILVLEAGIAALSDTEFLEATTSLIKTERPRIYVELDKLGIQYWKTQANFFQIKPEVDAVELVEALLMEGIMVRPVAGFGSPGCVRVTIGTREANDAFLTALKKVLS